MPSFLVVGEGFPAYTVLRFLLEHPQATLVGYIAGTTASVKAQELARSHDVPCFPASILTGEEPFPKQLHADWLVNINGVTLIADNVIGCFPRHSLNMHPALLPAYAGLHCHQWAIRHDEKEHGITIHFMDAQIDSGDIIRQERLAILDGDTGLSLFMKTMQLGTDTLIEVLHKVLVGEALSFQSQDRSRRRLFLHKHALNGRIDWSQPARAIYNFVRAANYEPLQSPTYQPEWESPLGPAVIRACRIGPSVEGTMPGQIANFVEGQGPLIACAEGQSILATKILLDGRIVAPDSLKARG
jgi:methionyl-tRNA formyltransferase